MFIQFMFLAGRFRFKCWFGISALDPDFLLFLRNTHERSLKEDFNIFHNLYPFYFNLYGIEYGASSNLLGSTWG
jgi:hypothetical protein